MTLAANLMVSMASKFESEPLLPTLMENIYNTLQYNIILCIYNNVTSLSMSRLTMAGLLALALSGTNV